MRDWLDYVLLVALVMAVLVNILWLVCIAAALL